MLYFQLCFVSSSFVTMWSFWKRLLLHYSSTLEHIFWTLPSSVFRCWMSTLWFWNVFLVIFESYFIYLLAQSLEFMSNLFISFHFIITKLLLIKSIIQYWHCKNAEYVLLSFKFFPHHFLFYSILGKIILIQVFLWNTWTLC